MQPACEVLPWDSSFFGIPIARLTARRLRPGDLESAVNWCRSHQIGCLYLLTAAGDPESEKLAENNGFRMTDRRLTLVRKAARKEHLQTKCSIRPSREEDIPALSAIARKSHHDSRFYHDPRFSRSRCDDLYAAWIEKSCRGWSQLVLVATVNEKHAGYCSCHLTSGSQGSIGLCAVAAEWQGNGFGQELVSGALQYLDSKGATSTTVVTQGRNIAGQRLYQKAGFVVDSIESWFHRWFD